VFTEEQWDAGVNELCVYELMLEVLGESNVKCQRGDHDSPIHPVWHFGHPVTFDVVPFITILRRRLDLLGWQFVTTGGCSPDGELRYFGAAPMLIVPVPKKIVYHTTQLWKFPCIFCEGLLPGNEERSSTKYPDTEGKIHVSLKPCKDLELGDQADFWKRTFETDNPDDECGIFEVNLMDLPPEARIYRDTHSAWGVVIDRVEQIAPKYLREWG
jgi:hypothetical protein